ncbi:MAG TPA: GNAT family N-acetyltransferase [Ferruginibacter sp.]|nr:GNAT family N-acetyltransferase [Ferruginibacter sp.]
MLIEQKQEGSKGSFYVADNGNVQAEMTYSMTGSDLMIIDHTEVADELRGKNVGFQLVNAAVEYARTANIKILPLCPFAKSVFVKKSAEFGDVLRD